ncbi:MAG: hypothetical protein ACFFDT_34115 [Candidatus Hodarchaeota archaeon]
MSSLKQGFIFVCGRSTQDECFEKMLFCTTLSYKDKALKVRKGDLGFLYNLDTDILYGIFEAFSDGSLNIEPQAFRGKFPAQVRVSWMKKCESIKNAKSLFRKLGIKTRDLILGAQAVSSLRSALEQVSASEEDFRKKYPRKYRTQDGHYVRTKSEAIIDNWLYNHLIVHAYERKLPIEENVYCDFFVPQGECYIEYWGMKEEEYLKREKKKRDLYQRHKLNLIELTETDIENIDDVLPVRLRRFLPKTFQIT